MASSRRTATTTFVLLPGLFGTCESLPSWLHKELARYGRVACLPYDDFAETIPGLAHGVWSAIDAAGVCSPIVLLGHSMGGMIAQAMTVARPASVAGVVLVSTACGGALRPVAAHASALLSALREQLWWSRSVAHATACATFLSNATACDEFEAAVRSHAIPVVVVHGVRDDVMPVATGEALFRRVAPYARMIRLEGVRHTVFHADKPDPELVDVIVGGLRPRP
jgi:pimeloyl-ACP methyl ester carboxylesterase